MIKKRFSVNNWRAVGIVNVTYFTKRLYAVSIALQAWKNVLDFNLIKNIFKCVISVSILEKKNDQIAAFVINYGISNTIVLEIP